MTINTTCLQSAYVDAAEMSDGILRSELCEYTEVVLELVCSSWYSYLQIKHFPTAEGEATEETFLLGADSISAFAMSKHVSVC